VVRSDEGVRSSSVTLTGSGITTNTAPASFTLDHAMTRTVNNGVVNLRSPQIEYNLQPGDTVTTATDSFIVGRITYTVSTTGSIFMDITQAS